MSELLLKPISVLIVDDSAYNRRTLTSLFNAADGVKVAGVAADGAEALRLLSIIQADVITLDLEMPRMDGFTFLRTVMSKRPTPVIVISSYSQKENVFRALELGAFDFVAKPERYTEGELEPWTKDLLAKVKVARSSHPSALGGSRGAAAPAPSVTSAVSTAPPPAVVTADRVVAVAASTGGPGALVAILSVLPPEQQFALVIAQHMPQMFTRAFAERLQRKTSLRVSEAEDGDRVGEGMAFVCPGGRCMELESVANQVRLRVRDPEPSDRYVPSADRLFQSAARVFGERAVGLILTGMGEDGVQGARAILAASGVVMAEHESTAVVDGMPSAAARAGAVTARLPLDEIAGWLSSIKRTPRAR